MLMALTREISPALESCQLTHVPRVPIDLERARAQHAAYEWALVEEGCTIRRLDAGPDMPDSVFIEDIAVVLDEGAVVCRPGAESRRVETAGVVDALRAPRTAARSRSRRPGRSTAATCSSSAARSSSARQRAPTVPPSISCRACSGAVGYTVRAVPVRGCLHLKSAVTAVAPDTLLINRACVPADAFRGLSLIDVDPEEPHAANGLAIGDVVIYPAVVPADPRAAGAPRPPRAARRGRRAAEGGGRGHLLSLIFDL